MIVSLAVILSACSSKIGKTTGESASTMENSTGELNLSMTENDLTVNVKNNIIDENNKVEI